MTLLAIIGGSGLTRFASLDETRAHVSPTPYGEPSAPLIFGKLRGKELAFLARHGTEHGIAPHEINYRANLWMLKDQNITRVVSIAAVGGIGKGYGPGSLVVPHQVIDYTWGRRSTFFEGQGQPVTHIDFSEPYTAGLRGEILRAARDCGIPVADGGVYAATQGPRLETAAEIDRLERDGADLVGMTAMPEAALARELGLQYASIAVVANHAAGRGDSAHAISMQQIMLVLEEAMGKVRKIIETMVTQ